MKVSTESTTWLQFRMLLWKNYLHQKRSKVVTVLELLLPTIFCVIIVFVRAIIPTVKVDNGVSYAPFEPNQIFFWPNEVFFTPSDPAHTRIMERAMSLIRTCDKERLINHGNCTSVPVKAIGFADEDTMVESLVNSLEDNQGLDITNNMKLGGIVFDSELSHSEQSYRIRLSATARNQKTSTDTYQLNEAVGWVTNLIFPSQQQPGPRSALDNFGGAPGYMREGFLPLQYAVDAALIEYKSNITNLFDSIEVNMWRYPYPPYSNDPFIVIIQANLPIVIMLGYMMAVIMVSRNIVLEKEKRLKEFMRIMGLKDWLHYAAHFTWNFMFLSITAIIIVILFAAPFTASRVLNYSDASVIFLFLSMYNVLCLCYCFGISACFNKGNTAAAVAGVLWFVTFLPYFFLQTNYGNLTFGLKMISCLLINTGMAMGFQVIGMYEGKEKGLQWNNLNKAASIDDTFTIAHVITMFIVNSLGFMILAWYVENVKPGNDGVPLPFYFPFTKSYWLGQSKDGSRIDKDHLQDHGVDATYFEAEPQNLDAVLKIKNLTKVFGKKTAVDHMNLNMYHGQITALLGHNGAGKSTTMSMLTGLLPPTSGSAIIDGFDLKTSLGQVRQRLGLCPQYNVLFDNLTVNEHLTFFAKLKGTEDVKGEARKMLQSLRLTDKTNALSTTLSGGMKRKLSIGIALIGGSKVIMLDEPTAGMDPSARRSTWDLLQREREGRSIILTTHYMDEADLLGDRIAIMAAGKVQCCGSSLFLKNKYGAGYRLTVVFLSGEVKNLPLLTGAVRSHIPTARLDSCAGSEASFILPQETADKFKDLFIHLESQQMLFGISSFGCSVTTMEEVFIRVGEQAEKEETDLHSTGSSNGTVKSVKYNGKNDSLECEFTDSDSTTDHLKDWNLINPKRNEGYVLLAQQFYAMMVKKVLHSGRNWKVLIPQLLLPVANIAMALAVNQALPTMGTSVPLPLNLDSFTKITVPIVSYLYRPDQSGKGPPGDMANLYWNQFDSDKVENRSINMIFADNRKWDGTNYVTLNKSVPEYTSDNATGLQTYLNFTAAYDVEEFNNRYLISGYFQAGNVVQNYVDQLKYDLVHNKDLTDDEKAEIINGITNTSQINRNGNKHVNISAVALFNDQPYHTPGIALNMLDNALLKYYTDSDDMVIRTTNAPLPATTSDQIAQYRNLQVTSFDVAFTIVLSSAFISSLFVIFLIRERISGAKHLQFVCGVHAINFWASAFVWDFFNLAIPCLLTVPVFYFFSVHAYTDNGRMSDVVIIYLLYVCAILPYTYMASFFFSHPTIGFVKLVIINIMTGPGFLMVIGILEIPQLNMGTPHDILYWIFVLISPSFAMGQAFRQYSDNYLSGSVCKPILESPDFCARLQPSHACCPGCTSSLCLTHTDDYMQWAQPGIGQMIFFLMLHCVVAWTSLLIIELGYLRRLEFGLRTKRDKMDVTALDDEQIAGGYQFRHLQETKSNYSVSTISSMSDSIVSNCTNASDEDVLESLNIIEDDDVSAEQTKVENIMSTRERDDKGVLIMNHISKSYANFNAVHSLSLCVEKGECFGLLGVNGAGKTSTFKMLTGDEQVTSGEAFIAQYNIRTQIRQAQQNLGITLAISLYCTHISSVFVAISYCPQFDALIDQMTGQETLAMYARLRGMPESDIEKMSSDLIAALSFQPHANKMTSAYSGGNKRKLSIAIALIGRPPIVLLDEPTAGIDPVARRHVWTVLTKVREAGTPLILTSHSMEECDSLCTRLAIMVAGKFKCLGSPQHLKAKFGSGYTVVVKLEKIKYCNRAIYIIQNKFPNTSVKDVHQRLIHFHVNSNQVPWSSVFGGIESLRRKLHIVDYSVSQTTLEQIFLNFSREQENKNKNRDLL